MSDLALGDTLHELLVKHFMDLLKWVTNRIVDFSTLNWINVFKVSIAMQYLSISVCINIVTSWIKNEESGVFSGKDRSETFFETCKSLISHIPQNELIILFPIVFGAL